MTVEERLARIEENIGLYDSSSADSEEVISSVTEEAIVKGTDNHSAYPDGYISKETVRKTGSLYGSVYGVPADSRACSHCGRPLFTRNGLVYCPHCISENSQKKEDTLYARICDGRALG